MATSIENNIKLENNQQNDKKPFIEVIEQPKNLIRFRYACEEGIAGSIQGISSKTKKKTYPTIKINDCGNYKKGILTVSCVTAKKINGKYFIHPHKIDGKRSKKNNCNSHVTDFEINDNLKVIECSNLTIQHAKKSDVKSILKSYEKINMDPFEAGFEHINSPNLIDMTCVRFCFQVTLTSDGKKMITLDPIVSNVMNSILSKSLRISRMNIHSAPASGGKEIVLLCDKVSKHDIKVLFYQQDNDGKRIWESYAQIVGVHRQIGIVFLTPKYDRQLSDTIEVSIELVRPSDGHSSEPCNFKIVPNRPIRNIKRLRNDEHDISEEHRSFKKIKLRNDTNQSLNFRNDSEAVYPNNVSSMSNIQFGEDRNRVFHKNITMGPPFYYVPNVQHQQYEQFNFAPYQHLGNSQIAITQQNESCSSLNLNVFTEEDLNIIQQVLDLEHQSVLPNQHNENSDQTSNMISGIIPQNQMTNDYYSQWISHKNNDIDIQHVNNNNETQGILSDVDINNNDFDRVKMFSGIIPQNQMTNDYSSQWISQKNNAIDFQHVNNNNNETQGILSDVDINNIDFDRFKIFSHSDNLPILSANLMQNIFEEINVL